MAKVMKESKRKIGLFMAAASSFCYGVAGTAMSAGMHEGFAQGWLICLRGFLILAVCFIASRKKRITLITDKKEMTGVLIYAGLNSLTNILIMFGYTMVGTGLATTLHYTHPLLIIICMSLFFRAKTAGSVWAAGIVAVATMFIMCGDLGSANAFGIAVALASAITWSAALIFFDRRKLGAVAPTVIIFWSFFFQILLGIGLLLFQQDTFTFNISPIPYAFISGAVIFTAEILFQKGIKTIGAGLSGILGIGEPVTTLILGWFLLKEQLSAKTAVCCFVLLSAIVFVLWSDMRFSEANATKS